jgi:hypothetical protein
MIVVDDFRVDETDDDYSSDGPPGYHDTSISPVDPNPTSRPSAAQMSRAELPAGSVAVEMPAPLPSGLAPQGPKDSSASNTVPERMTESDPIEPISGPSLREYANTNLFDIKEEGKDDSKTSLKMDAMGNQNRSIDTTARDSDGNPLRRLFNLRNRGKGKGKGKGRQDDYGLDDMQTSSSWRPNRGSGSHTGPIRSGTVATVSTERTLVGSDSQRNTLQSAPSRGPEIQDTDHDFVEQSHENMDDDYAEAPRR